MRFSTVPDRWSSPKPKTGPNSFTIISVVSHDADWLSRLYAALSVLEAFVVNKGNIK